MRERATFVECTFRDGQVWRVPALVIAENRARYYADTDPSTTYEEELEFTLTDRFELLDWMRNNMNPEDFEAAAEQIKGPTPIDFAEGCSDSDAEWRVERAPSSRPEDRR
jgi:hypothetical protein